MKSDEIVLNPELILNWDFKIDARGYRPQEVDKALDMVISDYRAYDNIVRNLKDQISTLSNEIIELKQKLRNAKANMEIVKNSEKEVTNVVLLRRVSQLEKIIYGKDND